MSAASLYAAIVRARAKRTRAKRAPAMLDLLDLARGGFFGFGKTKGGRKGAARKIMKLPKAAIVRGGFYYVKSGVLYVKKR